VVSDVAEDVVEEMVEVVDADEVVDVDVVRRMRKVNGLL